MQPLIDKEYLLQKMPGKGGWTFAEIPEIQMAKHAPFGWVCVKGTIDGYPISQYHLMPMGNGNLFFPVKAAIRKKIGKQAGDWVHIVLYADDVKPVIPEELETCLKDEPKAYTRFQSLKESQQKEFVNWIYEAKREETRVARMVKAIDLLLAGKTLRLSLKEQVEE